MKLQDLFESAEFKIANEHGELNAAWKSDLEDEEHKGYIPKGYKKKVLELKYIEGRRPGDGTILMKAFLASPMAKSAELIFLDPSPHFEDDGKSEDEVLESLAKFYRKFGFRNNPKALRMWLVQKGEIEDDKLPT